MDILKLKSHIYRYTGLYLASKEELEYLTSKEFWKSFIKMAANSKNDMSSRNIQGLLIGLLQSDHGFARPMVAWGWRRAWPIKFLAYTVNNAKSIWWDIKK